MEKYKVRLLSGEYVTVDHIDLVLAQRHNWFLNDDGYAESKIPAINGKRVHIKLHKLIAKEMGLNANLHTHHKDQDKLNCSRNNLREATNSQNNANRGHQKNSTTLIKGVFKKKNKFQVSIKKDGKSHYLGLYPTLIEAEYVYCVAAQLLFGEFAHIGDKNKFDILSEGWKKKIEILIKIKLN